MKPAVPAFLLLGALLGGCAITQPGSATPTVLASMTPSPTASQADTVALELRGDGLGAYSFGAAEDDVLAILEAELGQPDDSFQGVGCELNSESPWGETLQWGDLRVNFSAKTASRTAPRTLSAWSMPLPAEPPSPVTVQDGLPLDLSFAELQAQYPDGELETVMPGSEKVHVFTLASGITFTGVDAPESVRAGVFEFCE